MRPQDGVIAAAGRFLDRFSRPVTLLVAVSGGSDSTGLLVALAACRRSSIFLVACTVDHALRPQSAEEARQVTALCVRLGIPHVVRRWEGAKPATGVQAAARAARYRLLVEAADEAGADAILTAHTLDDQRETIFMRAARAAGGVGLAGMADRVLLGGRVWLMRPFLDIARADIRAFLQGAGEGWSDDPSNANRRFERVRVREDAARAGEGTEAGERLRLSQAAAGFLDAHVRALSPFLFLLPADGLADPAAWRGLLLLAATAGGRAHVLEAKAAARLGAFLEGGTLSRLTAGRVVFDRRREGLYLYRENRDIPGILVPPGETAVWDDRFRVENRSGEALAVSAAGEDMDPALRGVFRRAARAAPRFAFTRDVGMIPVIAPYADFLPGFDLPVAEALARLLGRAPFPAPPDD